ncbi:O-antigen ligase family protein [Sphingomonas sp. M1-B02]|uniref:O-antigen ligase family protein n=1 Tax=Sphingomonas sp. M1-B02 TaxID=3114300 RepID=UPI0022404C9E|nr:O-antigen ligase family protein [Sphingomonas sp. S6-11]UZK65045.1 O-antigen ligase family protein [Sphingomonas sp. S6-11]
MSYSKSTARARPEPTPADRASRRAFWVLSAMLVLAALFGGASRADESAQAVVRAGMAALLAVLVLVGRPAEWRSLRLPLLFVAVLALVMAAMLVPLPPQMWTALPGRALFAQAAPLAGLPQPWRPLAIAPPLGYNALFALIPPAAVLIGLVFLTPADRLRLAGPVLGLIVASAVLGVAQVSGGADSALRWYAVTNRESGVGFFANRNHQALFLAAGFPILALWAGSGADRWLTRELRVWLAGGFGLLLVVALLTTGSRAGLIVGAIALVGTIALHGAALLAILRRMAPRLRWMVLGGAVAGVVALTAVALASPQARSIVRLFTLNIADDTRVKALPTLQRVFGTYFPSGTGFGGFEPAFRAAEPDELLRLTYLNEAHNDYLQLAIEGGAVGLALLAAFIVWWGIGAVAALRMRAGHAAIAEEAIAAARAGALVILLVMVASAADYPIRTPLMMVLTVIAAAWTVLPRASVDTGVPLYDR